MTIFSLNISANYFLQSAIEANHERPIPYSLVRYFNFRAHRKPKMRLIVTLKTLIGYLLDHHLNRWIPYDLKALVVPIEHRTHYIIIHYMYCRVRLN